MLFIHFVGGMITVDRSRLTEDRLEGESLSCASIVFERDKEFERLGTAARQRRGGPRSLTLRVLPAEA